MGNELIKVNREMKSAKEWLQQLHVHLIQKKKTTTTDTHTCIRIHTHSYTQSYIHLIYRLIVCMVFNGHYVTIILC